MDIANWYQTVTRGDSDTAVSAKTGIIPSTLGRQKKRSAFSPETLVRIARAYGRNAVEPLLITGLLQEEDLHESAAPLSALDQLSDDALINELSQRLHQRNPQPAETDTDNRIEMTLDDGTTVMVDPMTLAAKRGDSAQEEEGFNAQP